MPRTGRDAVGVLDCAIAEISIHAPRMGRDGKNAKNDLAFLHKEHKNKRLMCKKCTSMALTAVCALKKPQ